MASDAAIRALCGAITGSQCQQCKDGSCRERAADILAVAEKLHPAGVEWWLGRVTGFTAFQGRSVPIFVQ